MALRDFLEFSSIRRGRAVPAVIAVVIAAFAWFGAQSMLSQFTSDSPPPPALELKETEAAPGEETSQADDSQADDQPTPPPPPIYPKVLVAKHALQSGVMLTNELVEWQEWTEPVDLNMVVLQDAVPLGAILGSVTRQAYAPECPSAGRASSPLAPPASSAPSLRRACGP